MIRVDEAGKSGGRSGGGFRRGGGGFRGGFRGGRGRGESITLVKEKSCVIQSLLLKLVGSLV